jgi:hypothetical protein
MDQNESQFEVYFCYAIIDGLCEEREISEKTQKSNRISAVDST